MTISQIKQLINKQAAISKEATEDYEVEACEIIVYDAILDYCMQNQFSVGPYKPHDLKYDPANYKEEQWLIITRLFADFLSEENKWEVDDTVLELLNYYYDRFWK
jgi:hypothetical protein